MNLQTVDNVAGWKYSLLYLQNIFTKCLSS